MNAADCFSATVDEADRKFARACRRQGLKPSFFTAPQTGPEGEALNIGVCRVGAADADNCLLLISGTHGIEGYAGAAIQVAWLKQFDRAILPPRTGIVVVHALNPWGMAWNRRENEDNVDVFRNLLYCDHPSEADPLYDVADDLLDLQHWNSRDWDDWQRRADRLIALHGRDRLLSAIRRGQHHRPRSMTYHGNGPSWSKLRLDEIVDTYLRGARRIAVIDIHTGFGDYGEGIVMSYDPPGSDSHDRVAGWFDGNIYTPGADPDIPEHSGRRPYEWIRSRTASASVTAEILEFGTFDPAEIGEIFNANHHYHVYGDPLSADGLKWGRRYRRYCYPEEEAWKDRVLHRGLEVVDRTLAGLAEWAQENGAAASGAGRVRRKGSGKRTMGEA